MKARREYRDRREAEVAVLDALVDRPGEGMTVFELRAAVDADIDTIEEALAALKEDDLITVDEKGNRVHIRPADAVIPDPGDAPGDGRGLIDKLRERFGL